MGERNTKTKGRAVTADERDWETCVEPDCGNRVVRFVRGDFYCRKHTPMPHLVGERYGSDACGCPRCAGTNRSSEVL